MNPTTARDEQELAAVLAHEIGHATDFLDDATLRRGNILGRIASLRGYAEKLLPSKPGGAPVVSKQDTERLRAEAEHLTSTRAEEEIDEEIVRTLPVAPEDIINIWNSIDKSKFEGLYKAIQRMSAAEKKRVIMAAVRGIVPEDLKQYALELREKTGRKVKRAITKRATKKKIEETLANLVEQEIRLRRLVREDVVRDELIRLTEWWSPYDKEAASKRYTKYRESSRELYAESVSVLLNAPSELQQRAPTFYNAWLEYIEEKPEAFEAYAELQDLLHGTLADLGAKRRQHIQEMFSRGEDKMAALEAATRTARSSTLSSVMMYLEQKVLDTTAPVRRRKEKLEKAGVSKQDLREAEIALYTLDELNYADNPNHVMFTQTEAQVFKPLRDRFGEDAWDAMGEYLFAKRIVEEKDGRHQVINPLGFTPSASQEQLDDLRNKLGAENFDFLEQTMLTWHRDILWPIAKQATRSGVYNRRTFENTLKPNRDSYATFAVFDHMDEARIGSKIYEQVGTFRDVMNPFDATMMKMVTLNRMIQLNQAKRRVIAMLYKNFSAEIRQIEVSRGNPVGRAKEGFEFVTYLEDGKLRAVEVPAEIARSFLSRDIGTIGTLANYLNTGVYSTFHPLFVTFSPGFIAANPFRDVRRTHIQLGTVGSARYKERVKELQQQGHSLAEAKEMSKPERITLGEVLRSWWKARKKAHKFVTGVTDRDINRMLQEKVFTIPYVEIAAESPESKRIDRMLAKHGIREIPRERSKVGKVLQTLLDTTRISALGKGIKYLGAMQETMSKIGAYNLLTEKGVKGQERSYLIRKRAGTPDYKQRGHWTPVTNGLLMYSKVRWNAMQTEYQLLKNPQTRGGYLWRRLLWTALPVTLTKAAAYGAFGAFVKAMYDSIPQALMDNYDTIPLAFVPDDDDDDRSLVAFVTIPKDDTGRFLSAVLSKAIDMGLQAAGIETREVTAGRAAGQAAREAWGELVPSLSPPIDIGWKWIQFGMGRNPYDSFWGKDVIPNRQWELGGLEATKKMAAWTFDKTGVISTAVHGVTGPLLGDAFDEVEESSIETASRMAFGFKRLFRVSDRGRREIEWAAIESDDLEEARWRDANVPKVAQKASREHWYLQRLGPRRTPGQDLKHQILGHWYYQMYRPTLEEMRALRDSGQEDKVAPLQDQLEQSAIEAVSSNVDELPSNYFGHAIFQVTAPSISPAEARETGAWKLLAARKLSLEEASHVLATETVETRQEEEIRRAARERRQPRRVNWKTRSYWSRQAKLQQLWPELSSSSATKQRWPPRRKT
jgi:hypothetical protein